MESINLVKLGSVIETVMGQAPSGKDCNRDEVGTPFVKVGEFGSERPVIREWTTDPKKLARKGDVLLCVVGATCGKINLGEDCAIGRSVAALRPLDGKVTQRYLYYYMQGKVEEFREGSQGAAQTVISKLMIADANIPLPSIPEQKSIVAILDQAFSGIEQARAKTDKNLKNARDLYESYLQQVFSQRGEGWEVNPLENISSIVNGYAFKSGDFSPDNEVKSIKITNVGVYEFVEESNNYLPKDYFDEYSQYQAFEGDVVVALTRTIISAGLKVAVVPASYNGALINQRVAAVHVDENVMPKEMLQAYLSTKVAIDYVRSNVSELMQPNLSIKDLKAFPIPVPPAEKKDAIKKEIADIREQTDKLIEIYKDKLCSLDELKKSILQKAFTGELTEDQEGAAA